MKGQTTDQGPLRHHTTLARKKEEESKLTSHVYESISTQIPVLCTSVCIPEGPDS